MQLLLGAMWINKEVSLSLWSSWGYDNYGKCLVIISSSIFSGLFYSSSPYGTLVVYDKSFDNVPQVPELLLIISIIFSSVLQIINR